MKILILFLLLSVSLYEAKVDEKQSSWEDDYDSYFDYDTLKELEDKIDQELENLSDNTHDERVEQDIQNFDDKNSNEKDIDYYQFEDNRDKSKIENYDNFDDLIDKNNEKKVDDYVLLWGDDSVAPDSDEQNIEEDKGVPSELVELTKKILKEDVPNKIEQIESIVDDNQSSEKDIMEETKTILEQDTDDFEKTLQEDIAKLNLTNDPIDDVIADETKKILEQTDDSFDEETPIDNEQKKETQETVSDDTVTKVMADLNADLDKLVETFNKLSEDSAENNDNDNFYDSYETADLESNEKTNKSDLISSLNSLEEVLNNASEQETLNDGLEKTNPLDNQNEDSEPIKVQKVEYLKDAIDDSKQVPIKDLNNTKVTVVKQISVDELISAELDELVDQFVSAHKNEFDVNSDDFKRNVPAINIKLSTESIVITSPNYPSAYPTNNVVDWILEGDGVGIEMNITDLAVNGALGDYLFVKPGGYDDSTHEGIVFTYRLNTERKYRFLDVNKMFIRFQSNIGMMFFTGWKMSVRLIAPTTTETNEPQLLEDTELTQPTVTVTFTFALNLFKFNESKDEFVKLLNDMTTMYIEDHDGFEDIVDHYAVVKSVSTCQINWPDFEQCSAVRFGIVLVKSDGVTFMEEKDIYNMWFNYKKLDDFAVRVDALGLQHFAPPDSPLVAWLIIATGVVTTMSMLAFILWRYSCFQTYTRMPTFNDTDSIQEEKRGLDLYPTPHQTLPPLYAENEYKWTDDTDTTRVDIGGLANKSYHRDTMYDFESDEEVQKIDKYTTDV